MTLYLCSEQSVFCDGCGSRKEAPAARSGKVRVSVGPLQTVRASRAGPELEGKLTLAEASIEQRQRLSPLIAVSILCLFRPQG